MSHVRQSIEGLSREETLEAAGFVASAVVKGAQAGDRELKALTGVSDRPYAHIADVEQLSRLVLLAAANDDEYSDKCRTAIAGAGRKQLILGGAEIVALAGIGLLALELLVNRGKSSDRQTVKVEQKNDGSFEVTIEKNVTYGVGGSLAEIMRRYFR